LSAAGFAVHRWPVWCAVWICQAWLLLTLVAVSHESAHSQLFGTRRVNRIAGTLAGLSAFGVWEVYRTQHILHHADTCGPDDSEGEPYQFTAKWQIFAAFAGGGPLYVAWLILEGWKVSFGAARPWVRTATARRRIRINVAAWTIVVVVAAWLLVSHPMATLAIWIIPVGMMVIVPMPFVLIPEHLGATGPGSPTINTRTCRSNWLMRWVFMNENLHTAHHTHPSTRWHDLAALDALLRPDIAEGWSYSGYLRFHRDTWRGAQPTQ
jgi:fatty acid desaturase